MIANNKNAHIFELFPVSAYGFINTPKPLRAINYLKMLLTQLKAQAISQAKHFWLIYECDKNLNDLLLLDFLTWIQYRCMYAGIYVNEYSH